MQIKVPSRMFDHLKINFREFILKPEYFDHDSWLHGTDHVYRVMHHTLNIGTKLKYQQETKLAFFAAFIHDMSRLHDGKCAEHGQRAADSKLPLFCELFRRNGMKEEEISIIYTAVAYHSLPIEIAKDHPHYTVTAILKDADALDRVRISPDDLKLKLLRFEESRSLVPFAEELYHHSEKKQIRSFESLLGIANSMSLN